MSVSIKLPLRNLNLTVIQALQEKYPEAEVQVELHPSKAIAPLSEARFWKIISALDWEMVDKDDDAVLEPMRRWKHWNWLFFGLKSLGQG